jgi:diguanylate cyclase (GGDEF)-like protein
MRICAKTGCSEMMKMACSSLCAIVDSLEIGVIVVDAEQRIVQWNRWLALRIGRSSEAASNRMLFEAIPEIAGTRLERAVEHALRDRMPSLLSPALNGTLLPLFQSKEDEQRDRRMQQMIHVLPLPDGGCLIQVSDVSATVSRERVLRQQAVNLRRNTTCDALTGIYNRRKFDELFALEFAKAQRKQQPLAVIIADIDHFSAYNQLYGREQGDLVLHDIAAALQDAIQPAGDVLARYGGEEFALVLPGMDDKGARHFAENLRLRIRTLKIANESILAGKLLTISLGVAVMVPDDSADTHTLLSSADVALYQAKHEGRDRAVYFSVDEGSFHDCA